MEGLTNLMWLLLLLLSSSTSLSLLLSSGLDVHAAERTVL